MKDLQGPRVQVARENTADRGGGEISVHDGRLRVAGRMRARDLGAVTDLAGIVFRDRKHAELRFANGGVWIVEAEHAALLSFARALAEQLGRPDLVEESSRLHELRTVGSSETMRQASLFVIALAIAIVTALGALMLRDRRHQRAREAAAHRRAVAVQAREAAEERAAEARLGAQTEVLAQALRRAMDAKQWKEAQGHHTALVALDPKHPILEVAAATLGPEVIRLEEEARQETVRLAILAARQALVDPVRCDDAQHVSQTWRGLERARPGDADWEAAATLAGALERCRLLVVKNMRRDAAEQRRQQRRRFATELPDRLRRDGHAAVARIGGKADTEVTIEIARLDESTAGRVVGASAGEGGLRTEAEQLGIRKLVLTDGEARFPYPLAPREDADAILPLLGTLGLAEPLSLRERAP